MFYPQPLLHLKALLSLGIICTLLLSPSISMAHGPGAAALQLIDEDGQGPSVVALTSGLAIRTESGSWRFLCESLWGEVETPLLGASAEGPVWIIGADQAYLLQAGEVSESGITELNSTFTSNLSAADSHVFALTGDGAVSVLWRLNDDATATPVFEDQETSWTSLVSVGDVAWLARPDESGMLMARVDSNGNVLAEGVATIDLGGGTGILRGTPDSAWLLTVGGTDFALYQIHDDFSFQLVAEDTKPILGPVTVGGRTLIGTRGELVDVTGMEPTTIATEENMACLRWRGEIAYACVLPDLVYADSEGFGETLFNTARLLGPVLENLDEETAETCWNDWLHFAFEGSIAADQDPDSMESVEDVEMDQADGEDPDADTMAAEMMETPEDDDGDGCGCTSMRRPGPPAGVALIGLALALVVLRRKRRS